MKRISAARKALTIFILVGLHLSPAYGQQPARRRRAAAQARPRRRVPARQPQPVVRVEAVQAAAPAAMPAGQAPTTQEGSEEVKQTVMQRLSDQLKVSRNDARFLMSYAGKWRRGNAISAPEKARFARLRKKIGIGIVALAATIGAIFAAVTNRERIARALRSGVADGDGDDADDGEGDDEAPAAAAEAVPAGTGAGAMADPAALFRAAQVGDQEEVQRLIAAGRNVNAADAHGETALMKAASWGHEPVVRQLLAADGIDVNAATPYGWTALMRAAYRGREAVVRELLDAEGIDVNAANDYGGTALMKAARWGHEPVVRQLLDAGADKQGAAEAAERAGHRELAQFIRDWNPGRKVKAARPSSAGAGAAAAAGKAEE